MATLQKKFFYLTKSNNIADLVDLEQGGLIESEIYAALSVNKKSITIISLLKFL